MILSEPASRIRRAFTALSTPALISFALALNSLADPPGPPRDSSAEHALDPLRLARPRLDLNSQKAHAQLLEKAKQGRIDVYFEGDSITRRWGASDLRYQDLLANWRQNFFGWNASDFGWGGDTVENVLWRLENGELDGVHPRIVVLMAGTNNLGGPPGDDPDPSNVDEVSRGIEVILAVLRQKAPEATVILMGVTPRGDRRGAVRPQTIRKINECLSGLADGKRVRFLNINEHLEGPDGMPLPGMTIDGLHPSVKGYQIWADALKPVFRELLGPPAQIDLAPPPTGDPSAPAQPSK
jgi:lysophospholipase L1-like esterase